MLNERLDQLQDYPFARLAALIADITPKANIAPVAMSIGDPQSQPPEFAIKKFPNTPGSPPASPSMTGLPRNSPAR